MNKKYRADKVVIVKIPASIISVIDFSYNQLKKYLTNACTIFIFQVIQHIKYVTNYRTYITTIQEEKKE